MNKQILIKFDEIFIKLIFTFKILYATCSCHIVNLGLNNHIISEYLIGLFRMMNIIIFLFRFSLNKSQNSFWKN